MHCPAVAEDAGDADVEGWPDYLDAGKFDGEVPEVGGVGAGDWDVMEAGDAAVVVVH